MTIWDSGGIVIVLAVPFALLFLVAFFWLARWTLRFMALQIRMAGAVDADGLIDWGRKVILLGVLNALHFPDKARELLRPDKRHLHDEFTATYRTFVRTMIALAVLALAVAVLQFVFEKLGFPKNHHF